MKKTIFITGLVVAAIAVMQAKDPVIAPSYAWKMLPPLGLREPSTIDTTLYNYAQESVRRLCRRLMPLPAILARRDRT